MFINKSIKKIILSLVLVSIATPAHGWWFTDWLFGKSDSKAEVKASTAGSHLLAAAVGAVALSSCFWGWRLYTQSREEREYRDWAESWHAKTLADIHNGYQQKAKYDSRMLQMAREGRGLAENQVRSDETIYAQTIDKYADELKQKDAQIKQLKKEKAAAKIASLRTKNMEKQKKRNAFHRWENYSRQKQGQAWFSAHQAVSPRS